GRLHAKEPGDRVATAQEVADVLSGHLALVQQPPRAPSPPRPPFPTRGEGGADHSPSPLRGRGGWGVRGRRRFGVAALLVGLLLALAALAAVLRLWPHHAADSGDGGAAPGGSAGPVPPLDLRRKDIPPILLTLAGGGDPAQAPAELVAVLGDGRFLLPRIGSTNWMAQSPDGKVLAAPLEEDVLLFDVQTGEYLRSLQGPGGRVVHVTFSRDGQLLAATTWHEGERGAVRVWEVGADRELYTNQVPDPRVSGATAFSADGKCLVTEGWQRLFVWDARTGKVSQTLTGQSGGLGGMTFSPDGRRLAVADWHGKRVRVFDWDGEKLAEVRSLDGHRAPVTGVAYSPDGKYLASGDAQVLKLWNAETLEEIRTVETPAQQLAFSPDSRTLVAATTNDLPRTVHTFTRWGLGHQEDLPPLSVEVSAVPAYACHHLSRDGKVLFVAQGGKSTCIKAI